MRTMLLIAGMSFAVAGSLAAQTPPASQEPASQAIVVSNAWARATAGANRTGAAYVTLTDNGQPDRVVGASTPVAGMAQLHETINASGVMQMRPVAGVVLVAGKPITFAPGGLHVMLMDLKHSLKQGETFPLTLTFEHAQPITVQVKVAGPGATTAMSNMQGMQAMPGMSPSGSTKP